MPCNLDPTSIKEDSRVPAGQYVVLITSVKDQENIETSKGPMSKLNARAEIICDGEYKGETLWLDFTYEFEGSPQAERIGQKQLATLHAASQCQGPISADSLENGKPFVIDFVWHERNGYTNLRIKKMSRYSADLMDVSASTSDDW